MRIQHNIAAMNAYRQYSNNTSAVSKNLEKLSSGYKINRAGDDAAGLAISEKMRAQISGLNAAQKNVKDGVNLVKTAEGAMQEVQDMLNRMVTLATQSANGTYDNEVDRANLQKEVDQLNEEINRIADSANFNGIKLLDGSLEGDTTKYTTLTSGKKFLQIADYDPTQTGAITPGSTLNNIGNSTFVHADAQSPSLTKFTLNLSGLEFKGSTADATVSIQLKGVGGNTAAVAMEIGITVGTTGLDSSEIAQAVYNKLADSDYQVSVGGVSYNVKLDGSSLTFEMDADKANSITNAESFTGNFTFAANVGATGVTTASGVNTVAGTTLIEEGKLASSVKLAGTVTMISGTHGDAGNSSLQFENIRDGMGIKLGDETYVLALTDKTKNAKYGEGYKVIDLTDLVDPDAVPPKLLDTAIGADKKQTLSEVAARITQAAKDNEMWTVGATAVNDGTTGATYLQLAVLEKTTYEGGADLTTVKQIQKQISIFDNVSVREDVTKGKGKPLTLQIGDTSEAFNQLRVSIGDIHTAALGIDKINVGTQDGAAAAIDTIKNAINTVSAIRGTLGATQNRLEHTQNNLSVMAENIQDAESNIRDTDVAEEMMAYTKNNILVQSAQAMLAQANQIPQGVLQLLG